jgi:hypothetical protein
VQQQLEEEEEEEVVVVVVVVCVCVFVRACVCGWVGRGVGGLAPRPPALPMPAARGQLPQKKISGNLDDVLGVALRRWRGWRGSGSSMSWAGSRWPSASTGNSGPHLMAEAGADEAAKQQRVAMTADSPKGTGGCAALHHRLHYALQEQRKEMRSWK